MKQIGINVLLTLPLVGAYAMFAIGIVVIYRASRVLNLAHGAMATLPAYAAYSLATAGTPTWIAFIVVILLGAALGAAVEFLILKPLRNDSPTAQTVGTVAALGLIIALVAKIWGTAPLRAPPLFPEGSIEVGHTPLHFADIGIAAFALIAAVVFTFIFQKTEIGLAMRGAAENRRAATLMGIDPNTTTRLAWILGGALAAASGVLLAAATNLHPYTLSRQVLPGFVAALLGGLGSLPGAIAGSAIVGVTQGLVSSAGPLAGQPGSAQLVLAVVALIVMAARGRRLVGSSNLSEERGRAATRERRLRLPMWSYVLAAPIIFGWVWLPFIPDSIRRDANLAAIYVVVSISLVILTGWVGQISLSQATFVGISAFVTGIVVRHLGIPFPVNLPIAAAASALAAMVLGAFALRVRGLYLAVATLIFGWMADAYLFKSSWFVGEGGSSTITGRIIGRAGSIPSFDLSDSRGFWLVAVAAAVLAVVAASNLKESRTGRAFYAVRGSEIAAASMGINVVRTKLLAFAFSGVLAGVAGNLIMVDQRTATAEQFSFTASLFFLSIAAVGGLTKLGGVVVAATGFAALNEVYYRVPAFQGFLDITSSALLLSAVLLSSSPARQYLASLRRDRVPEEIPPPPLIERAPPPVPRPTEPLHDAAPLSAESLEVRFGGLTAIQELTIEVRRGEVVGLIGPNGAGKTTAFNVVSGFVAPMRGRVSLFGKEVTSLPVHERSALGLARTFQVLQLAADSSVYDNLMVATHLHSRSGIISNLFVTDRSLRAEKEARERVDFALWLADLESVGAKRISDLPFGILRRVDVARALVTGAPLILLDEPASGLDDRETDELSALLRRVRDEMDASMLIVEHDVRFLTGLSDRIYVLDQGRIIASGRPEEIQRDPLVVGAYLGTAPEAAARLTEFSRTS